MIDPFDGTKDFIQGTGEYAIHVALMYKKNLFWYGFATKT